MSSVENSLSSFSPLRHKLKRRLNYVFYICLIWFVLLCGTTTAIAQVPGSERRALDVLHNATGGAGWYAHAFRVAVLPKRVTSRSRSALGRRDRTSALVFDLRYRYDFQIRLRGSLVKLYLSINIFDGTGTSMKN